MNQHSYPPLAEKVGIAEIRIRKTAHSLAVLGSFVAADRLLKAWAQARDCSECEFEIRYLDGSRLAGRYPMWSKASARQSLGAHVRRMIGTGGGTMLCFGAGTGPGCFLERYEVEDFAES